MIDHAVLRVKDLGKSRRFYAAALAPLGYRVLKEFPGFVGLGAGDKTDIWIGQAEPTTTGVHLAIASRDRRTVDAFHAAALKAGGKDNGAPGVGALEVGEPGGGAAVGGGAPVAARRERSARSDFRRVWQRRALELAGAEEAIEEDSEPAEDFRQRVGTVGRTAGGVARPGAGLE